MPRISERGTVAGSSTPWAVSKISDMIWGVINVIVFYFKSLIDPITGSVDGLRSNSGYGRGGGGGPPRPPGRRNIRTIADALGGPDSMPPPPPGG